MSVPQVCSTSSKRLRRNLTSVASPILNLPPADPSVAETADFAVTRDFERVAADAVDPGVADFLRDDGKRGGMRLDGVGDMSEIGGADFGVGEMLPKIEINGGDFFGGVGAGVVVGHDDGVGEIGAGDDLNRAVVVVVGDDELRAGGILPAEEWRENGGGAGVVDADVEEFDSGGGERRDDAARVAGDVGHFGAGGFAAEALVERLRERDRAGDERRIHQLGLPTEWDRVPGDEVGRDGLLHFLALIAWRLARDIRRGARSRWSRCSWRGRGRCCD